MAQFRMEGTETTLYYTTIEAESIIEALELAGEMPWDEWDEQDNKIEFEGYRA